MIGTRVASFAVPVLTAILLLYQVLARLQVGILRRETVLAACGILACGLGGGLIAALGGRRARAVALTVAVVIWLDVAAGLSGAFETLTPTVRASHARDRQRVRDIGVIQVALDSYIQQHGAPPMPDAYGEGTGPPEFWEGWWDVSSVDADGNGRYFLDFLVESDVLPEVPLDPVNQADGNVHPGRGQHYVFYVVPPGYGYAGGACEAFAGQGTYLLAVTDLEGQTSRPPTGVEGSGCACLWRDHPDFFQPHFDYLVCGHFAP